MSNKIVNFELKHDEKKSLALKLISEINEFMIKYWRLH